MGVLSGGEQQRLLIAQALSPDLKVLLLDEPLASLDLRSQHEIVSLVDGPAPPAGRGCAVRQPRPQPCAAGGGPRPLHPQPLSRSAAAWTRWCSRNYCRTCLERRCKVLPRRTRGEPSRPRAKAMGGARWTFFNCAFMRNAFLAGTLAAVCAGVIGYFVVLRRLSFASHALAPRRLHRGHRRRPARRRLVPRHTPVHRGDRDRHGPAGRQAARRDAAIGTTLAFTMGLGLFFLSLSTKMAGLATNILFGDVLTISDRTVWFTFAFAVVSLATMAVIYRPLLFASVDPEVAAVRGVPVRLLGVVFMVLLAWTVAQAVQVVGVLLIFGLLVTPAAAAQHLTARAGAGRGLVGAAGGRLGLGRADDGLLPVPRPAAQLLHYDDLVPPLCRHSRSGPRRRQHWRRSARAFPLAGATEVRVMETVGEP